MKTKNFYSTVLVILAMFIMASGFYSCKNVSKKKNPLDFPEEEVDVKDRIGQEVSEFVYPLPETDDVVEMINEIGIPYIAITNSVDNVNKYFTAKSKAYNIGVYGTDLSYSSTYNLTQETMLYLEAINQLGNDLGISSIYNEDLLNSIDENINNKEKLVEIITTTVYDTYDFLNKNGKGDLAILMVAGGWVEAMYLSANVSLNASNNAELLKIIYSQKPSLEKLMSLLEERKENSDIQELMDLLQPVKNAFTNFESENITPEQFNAFDQAINDLREEVVNM
jgi:hypothetical protein